MIFAVGAILADFATTLVDPECGCSTMTNLNTIDPAAVLDEGKFGNNEVVIGKSRIILRRFLRNRTAVAGLAIFLALTLFSFIGGFFGSWDKETIDPFNIGMPPSAEHLLGTSQAGIDLYALTVEGTRVSILIGVVVGLVSVLIAAVYGCTMAFFGRKVDKVMLFILEALIMMPALLVVAVATSGGGNGPAEAPSQLAAAHHRAAGLQLDGPPA